MSKTDDDFVACVKRFREGVLELPQNTTICCCDNSKMDHLNNFIIFPQVRNHDFRYKNPPFEYCPWYGGKLELKQ